MADTVFARGLDALNDLTVLLAEETRLIASGQIEAGLALAAAKAGATDTLALVLAGLRAMPAGPNGAPHVEALRFKIEAIQETIAVNLAVLATARTVSENLLRDVARRLTPPSPDAYGPGRTRAGGAPLLISRAT